MNKAATCPESLRPSVRRQAPQSTLPSLTGMRWLAALLVFGLHLRNLGYLNGSPVDIVGWAFMAGATGVSFFFVLSGFVLTWSARPHDTAAGFWRRRVARIYPVHLVTAAVAMVLGSATLGEPRPTGPQLAANLLLIHSWWPAWWQTLNPVSWSLACEAFFYATFPALAWVLRRLGHRALTALGAAAIATVMVLPWANTHYGLGLVLFSSPLARLPEFILGAVLARLVQLGRWRGPGLRASLAIAAVGYIVASLAGGDFAFAACTVLGFAVLIAAAAVADLHETPSVLRHPAFVRLGELSFAFYMVHILVLHAGSGILATLPAPIGAVAALTASLTLSWLIYSGVERPARQLILAHGLTSLPALRLRQRRGPIHGGDGRNTSKPAGEPSGGSQGNSNTPATSASTGMQPSCVSPDHIQITNTPQAATGLPALTSSFTGPMARHGRQRVTPV